LLRGNIDKAHVWFARASASDPGDAAAILKTGFIDMQLGNFKEAALHVQPLVTVRKPADKLLLSAAYMTRGGALLAMGDTKGADEHLALAIKANDNSAPAYMLWSEVKRAQGNNAAAD